jgi:hypothetical protein
MTKLCGVTRGGRLIAAWLAASLAIAGALFMPAIAQANNPGAIWTTTSTCGPVNVNNYASKLDVYLNGGPDSHGANGLTDGRYWVEVIVPGGEVLGRSQSAVVEVVDGRMAQRYQLWAITRQAPAFTLVGYLDTTNPGGSYNVLVRHDQERPLQGRCAHRDHDNLDHDHVGHAQHVDHDFGQQRHDRPDLDDIHRRDRGCLRDHR